MARDKRATQSQGNNPLYDIQLFNGKDVSKLNWESRVRYGELGEQVVIDTLLGEVVYIEVKMLNLNGKSERQYWIKKEGCVNNIASTYAFVTIWGDTEFIPKAVILLMLEIGLATIKSNNATEGKDHIYFNESQYKQMRSCLDKGLHWERLAKIREQLVIQRKEVLEKAKAPKKQKPVYQVGVYQ